MAQGIDGLDFSRQAWVPHAKNDLFFCLKIFFNVSGYRYLSHESSLKISMLGPQGFLPCDPFLIVLA